MLTIIQRSAFLQNPQTETHFWGASLVGGAVVAASFVIPGSALALLALKIGGAVLGVIGVVGAVLAHCVRASVSRDAARSRAGQNSPQPSPTSGLGPQEVPNTADDEAFARRLQAEDNPAHDSRTQGTPSRESSIHVLGDPSVSRNPLSLPTMVPSSEGPGRGPQGGSKPDAADDEAVARRLQDEEDARYSFGAEDAREEKAFVFPAVYARGPGREEPSPLPSWRRGPGAQTPSPAGVAPPPPPVVMIPIPPRESTPPPQLLAPFMPPPPVPDALSPFRISGHSFLAPPPPLSESWNPDLFAAPAASISSGPTALAPAAAATATASASVASAALASPTVAAPAIAVVTPPPAVVRPPSPPQPSSLPAAVSPVAPAPSRPAAAALPMHLVSYNGQAPASFLPPAGPAPSAPVAVAAAPSKAQLAIDPHFTVVSSNPFRWELMMGGVKVVAREIPYEHYRSLPARFRCVTGETIYKCMNVNQIPDEKWFIWLKSEEAKKQIQATTLPGNAAAMPAPPFNPSQRSSGIKYLDFYFQKVKKFLEIYPSPPFQELHLVFFVEEDRSGIPDPIKLWQKAFNPPPPTASSKK